MITVRFGGCVYGPGVFMSEAEAAAVKADGRKETRFCSRGCCSTSYSRDGQKLMAKRRVKYRIDEIERRGRMTRLEALDAAYAAAYPHLATGAVRGRVSSCARLGCVRRMHAAAIVERWIAR